MENYRIMHEKKMATIYAKWKNGGYRHPGNAANDKFFRRITEMKPQSAFADLEGPLPEDTDILEDISRYGQTLRYISQNLSGFDDSLDTVELRMLVLDLCAKKLPAFIFDEVKAKN
jgi:hypothetical protein